MKKYVLSLLLICFITSASWAQTRVFKQISEEIQTQTQAILQDNTVIGYIAFTRLEKTSSDSFSYKLSIIDENLNDIGEISFRETNMSLYDVAFENDVLCISYLKSSIAGKNFNKYKDYEKNRDASKNSVSNQFLTLDGKIVAKDEFPVDLNTSYSLASVQVDFKNPIKVKNIPGKGFCCMYQDYSKSEIVCYNDKGGRLWGKKLEGYKSIDNFLVTTDVLYVLGKSVSGNTVYDIQRFNTGDGKAGDKYVLKDNQNSSFGILNFQINPVTGKPYLAGRIINKQFERITNPAKAYAKGMLKGVFSVTFSGLQKRDVKENFTYWSDGSLASEISRKGRLSNNKCYPVILSAFQDAEENVYFIGDMIKKKPKIGSIVSAVILSPLIVVSPLILMAGTSKYISDDVVLLKQSGKKGLNVYQTIDKSFRKLTKFTSYENSVLNMNSQVFYNLYNPQKKMDVFIYKDNDDYKIYDILKKQIIRTVPGSKNNTVAVGPAKEGHIMIIENNRKEKYTKLSIEAL